MQLRQLKYFVAAIQAGTLQVASKRLYVAQSAISKQIANLEADLGVRLLERGRRGVRPTQAGECFYQQALVVLSTVENARRAVDGYKSGDGAAGDVGCASADGVGG